jgi:hypothetical protein
MADSITRADLKVDIARFLGISRDDSLWTDEDEDAIDTIIEGAERDFYWPPILPGEKSSHPWTFLRPIMTLPVSTNIPDYDMPEDFGGFVESELTYVDQDDAWHTVRITSISEILRHRNADMETTGKPYLAAEQWLPSDGEAKQRKSLMLWPTPDEDLTLRAPYYCLPYAVSDSKPYPLGGQPHAATIRAAALANAELEHEGAQGAHYVKFMERLAVSVSIDRQLGPKNLGNLNRPDRYCPTRHRHRYVTYNGNSYSGD